LANTVTEINALVSTIRIRRSLNPTCIHSNQLTLRDPMFNETACLNNEHIYAFRDSMATNNVHQILSGDGEYGVGAWKHDMDMRVGA